MKNVLAILVSLLCLSFSLAQNSVLEKRFYFGSKPKNDVQSVAITKAITYDALLEYGFDYQTNKHITIHKNGVSSSAPFYFSIKLPEGNYKITLELGGKTASKTTVKAESRRLMLREVEISKEQTVSKSFVVNVRTPKIDANRNITIKDRERHYLNWDDKLTLEFLGQAALKSIIVTPVKTTTLFLAGDSTVTDQDLEPWASWGQFATNYFNTDVVIANYAASGASLSSFKARKRLEKICSLMQAGDYLFIEFAHNDEKRKGEGIGPWQSYTKLLKTFITKARSKGGIPVLLTPVQRRAFNPDGTLKPTHGDYPDAIRQVAKDLQVPLIDLTKMTTTLYESWGDQTSRQAFVQYPAHTFPGQTKALKDNTHFNSFGANEIAKCVITGIRNLNLNITKFIKPNTPDYNPEHPDNLSDWTVPMSLRFENNKPDGN